MFEQNKGILLSKFGNSKTTQKEENLEGYNVTAAVNARVRDVKRTVEVVQVIQGVFSVSKNWLPSNNTSIFNQLQRQQHARHLEITTHVIIAGLTTTLRHLPIRR